MAHEIDYRNDRWSFAFAGDRSAIWHGHGQQALPGWTREDWQHESGLDFEVETVRLVGVGTDECSYSSNVDTHRLLVRSDTKEALSITSPQWRSAQNGHAFDFAEPFVESGFARYDTAGALFGGRRCFLLLKTQEGFSLPGSDDTEGYILIQISHEYGICDLVLPTSIRVVCNNTRAFALEQAGREKLQRARVIHVGGRHFDPEKAKVFVEGYRDGIRKYAEQAKHLASRHYTQDELTQYIRRVFSLKAENTSSTGYDNEISEHGLKLRRTRNANKIEALLKAVTEQPGADLSAGTWWSAYNAVTWYEDHGRHANGESPVIANRIYGDGADTKERALRAALQFAG